MPLVVAGEPVPPPFYTLFVRLWNEDKDVMLAEAARKFFVPQVVKVEMTDAAFNEFKEPILYPETFYPHLLGDTNVVGCASNVLLYAGCSNLTKSELLAAIAQTSQSFYPEGVNVRFTADSVSGRTKTSLIDCDPAPDAPLGITARTQIMFPNAVPSGVTSVHINAIRKQSSEEKYRYENELMSPALAASCEIPTLSSFSSGNLAHAVASTVSHETGHLLGLVSESYLGGKYNLHNANSIINGWIMNHGAYTPSVYHLGFHSARTRSWKHANVLYLQFVLPKGDQ
jgi:hypothetical protein